MSYLLRCARAAAISPETFGLIGTGYRFLSAALIPRIINISRTILCAE